MLKHQKRGGNGASQSLPYPIFISHKIKDGELKQAALNRPKYTLTAGYGLPSVGSCLFRGTQREYSSKQLKHSIVKRILVFKR